MNNSKWNLSRFCSTALAALTLLALSVVAPESETHADPKVKSDNNGSINHQIAGFVPVDPATDQPLTSTSGTSLGTTAQAGCNVATGLVDVVAPRVKKDLLMQLVLGSPAGDIATFKISSADSSIISVEGMDLSANPTVTVLKDAIYSNTFRVKGNKIGSTQITNVPENQYAVTHYAKWNTAAGVWDFNGFLDFNALNSLDPESLEITGDGVCSDNSQGGDPTKVSQSQAVRTTCGGQKVKGVRSDGVSRILLRSESGLEGKSCFKVISDAKPDPGSITDPFPTQDPDDPYNVLTELYNQKHWAYSTYLPPQSFVDAANKQREVEVEIAFTPKNPVTGDYTRTVTAKTKEKIKIVREPVLLVHGIWSNKRTWGDGYTNPSPLGAG